MESRSLGEGSRCRPQERGQGNPLLLGTLLSVYRGGRLSLRVAGEQVRISGLAGPGRGITLSAKSNAAVIGI